MQDLKQQLAPSWSPVNIGVTVVLFLMGAWPLGLLMIAYIVWGTRLGLDLGTPQTLSVFAQRITTAAKVAKDSFSKH